MWPTNKAALGVCYRLLSASFGDGISCTSSPNHNIHKGKWCLSAMKNMSFVIQKCWKCIFQRSGEPNFKILTKQTVKKLNLREKSVIRQKFLDKTFRHLSLSSIIPYILGFTKIFVLFLRYNGKISLQEMLWDFLRKKQITLWHKHCLVNMNLRKLSVFETIVYIKFLCLLEFGPKTRNMTGSKKFDNDVKKIFYGALYDFLVLPNMCPLEARFWHFK